MQHSTVHESGTPLQPHDQAEGRGGVDTQSEKVVLHFNYLPISLYFPDALIYRAPAFLPQHLREPRELPIRQSRIASSLAQAVSLLKKRKGDLVQPQFLCAVNAGQKT